METEETIAVRPSIRAKCRMKSGMVAEVDVLDLSIAGCMVERKAISFEEGARVLVRLPGLEFMPSKVLWIENGLVGIEFERDLHDAVFENLIGQLRPRR
ncbi:PilZ domain-containing protein [Novosphingobium kunmingense]|uniref:PilZ domain-containing protein n=1 Tax=Novosphingobium kunmingense TaxID=1211806 RepID=A0A2N0I1Y9_9SPHN|nr:PilZ domain-containing protein [Novosphingobium kunmingense]PKB25208.1 PilZ domain-containing protein [Novosphingobium kunmingense]